MAYVARLRGFKAALTTRINVATAQYDAVQGLQHPTARQLEDLVTASNRVQEQFDRLQEFCIERITAAADDDEADPWQTELNQAETRATPLRLASSRWWVTSTRHPQPRPHPQPPPAPLLRGAALMTPSSLNA
jgi:hypothetical protein